MSGLPSPERLAALTKLARDLRAAGAPDAVTMPIVLDEDGYAYGLYPSDPEIGTYVHAGLRLAWAPMPIQAGLLLSIWGGPESEPGYEDEGLTVFMTRDGLRHLAADLVAIADASGPA